MDIAHLECENTLTSIGRQETSVNRKCGHNTHRVTSRRVNPETDCSDLPTRELLFEVRTLSSLLSSLQLLRTVDEHMDTVDSFRAMTDSMEVVERSVRPLRSTKARIRCSASLWRSTCSNSF